MRTLALAIVSALVLGGCRGPRSIEANVEFQTERGVVRGVSTESGILALADIVPPTGELSFRYRSGNGFFDDVAAADRRSDALVLMQPKSTRLNHARFAAFPAAGGDSLFLEVRTGPETDILRCHLLDGGARGDLLVLDEGDFYDVLASYTGAGVYAWREDMMQLVGVLNGVYCESPHALAFVGLDEMATLIPAGSNYFTRRTTPRRADFEYGIPRDFAGERAQASDPPSPVETTEPVESSEPPPDPGEGS